MTDYRERPILFNDDMVRAIRDDRKTQTRRLVKQPRGWPEYSHCDPFAMPPAVWWWNGKHDRVGIRKECPYGQTGDRLWVREAWRLPDGAPNGWVDFRANETRTGFKWRPSIHMPRWASRITLEITGVRVERLQKISEADAKAEGAEPMRYVPDTGEYVGWSSYPSTPTTDAQRIEWGGTYKDGFRFVWESINGTGSWDENPWVWVVDFRRLAPFTR